MAQRWELATDRQVPDDLWRAVGGHPLVARLLARRGLADPWRALAFLDAACYIPASPRTLPGAPEAAALLRRAIGRGERVRIWGDFDADGQTATAVLYEALRAASAAVDYRVPRRDEGHGLHSRVIEEALQEGISLLITCDTGIGALDVVADGVAHGLAIIITDHHDLPETLPPAQVVIDPKMLAVEHPLYELSGVGVAYMVARALLEDPAQEPVLQEMLDLVAIGMITDVATQVDDVRYLIQCGLRALRATRRTGLRAMVHAAQMEILALDEGDVSFQLGPRLDAAGRLDDAGLAVRLLTTRDQEEAQVLAEKIEALNRDRQAATRMVRAAAEEQLRRDPELRRQPALVLDGEGWEVGVLGRVARDLVRRYDRPAILISRRQDGPAWASARSVEGVDIHEAILTQRELLAEEGGGHPMAAGFSIQPQQIAAFREGLWAALRPLMEARPEGVLTVDAEIPWNEVTLDMARELARLAPHGAGNPRPVLQVSEATLTRVEDISRQRETEHRRLFLANDEGRSLRALWFAAGDLPQPGERLDLATYVGISRWQGRERLALELVDWRPAGRAASAARRAWVAGREVADWRRRGDADSLLAELHARHAASLLVWAEGAERQIAGATSGSEIAGRQATALAILTAPAGPEVLRTLLSRVQPMILYLLPPQPVPEPAPEAFLRQVVGMLRVALRDHDGHIDATRMAARIGARPAAVVAALRGLEAAGRIALRYEDDGLRACLPQKAVPEEVEDDNGSGEEHVARREQAAQQARQALAYLLRETRAYRAAYASEPVEALLGSENPPNPS